MRRNEPKKEQKSKGPPRADQRRKRSARRDHTDDRFPAGPFAHLGKALFGEQGWERKMALELKIDERTVRQWAEEGVPASMLEALRHISSHHRAKIQEAMKMPGMPDSELKPWQRGGRILEEYELLSQDPSMLPSSTDDEHNRKIVVRIIADLLHFCMLRMSQTRSFIDMDAVIKDAIALYNSDPEHCATPIGEEKQQRQWLSKDFIPFVLTDDPAKIADFGKTFGMTQDEAVDDLIETTDWGGQDLPHLVGNKGTQADRLRELRRVLREAGQTEEEKGPLLTTEFKTPEQDYSVLLKRQCEWMREHMPKLLAGLEPLIKEYKLSDHDAHDLLFDAQCGHDSGVKDKNTIEGMAYDLKHGLRPEKR